MGQILIRNLDDDVIAYYKARAAEAGLSLEAYLREFFTDHVNFDVKAFLGEVDACLAKAEGFTPLDTEKMIRLNKAQRDDRAIDQFKLDSGAA